MTILAAQDEELELEEEPERTRPLAFGYICVPSWYEHAYRQWRRQLQELADREGFTVLRWYSDHGARRDGLVAMLEWLRGSGTTAIFVPHIQQLQDALRIGDIQVAVGGDMRQQLTQALGRQIFVLSEGFAPIAPPPRGPVVGPPPRGRRWGRRRRR